jgi:hypothetical protein
MTLIYDFLSTVTIGDAMLAFLACCLLHETAVAVLPDRIAGPGGWFIDTSRQ